MPKETTFKSLAQRLDPAFKAEVYIKEKKSLINLKSSKSIFTLWVASKIPAPAEAKLMPLKNASELLGFLLMERYGGADGKPSFSAVKINTYLVSTIRNLINCFKLFIVRAVESILGHMKALACFMMNLL